MKSVRVRMGPDGTLVETPLPKVEPKPLPKPTPEPEPGPVGRETWGYL